MRSGQLYQTDTAAMGFRLQVLQGWIDSHYLPEVGLFYQTDTADGGEDSISGDGCRVSINAAMVRLGR